MSIEVSFFAICGLDELARHATKSVTHVMSLLDPEWPEPPCLQSVAPMQRIVLRFHDDIDPGPGIVLPSAEHVGSILKFGELIAADSRRERQIHLLVHCHMGISRSSAAMAILLAQFARDEDDDAIFTRLVEIRPQSWPNSRMIELADGMMRKNGQLMNALGRLYARQLTARPELAGYMRQLGRSRELELARRGFSASCPAPP